MKYATDMVDIKPTIKKYLYFCVFYKHLINYQCIDSPKRQGSRLIIKSGITDKSPKVGICSE